VKRPEALPRAAPADRYLGLNAYSVDAPLGELSLDDFLSIGSAGVPFMSLLVCASALNQP
jgi:hypothetical protein